MYFEGVVIWQRETKRGVEGGRGSYNVPQLTTALQSRDMARKGPQYSSNLSLMSISSYVEYETGNINTTMKVNGAN